MRVLPPLAELGRSLRVAASGGSGQQQTISETAVEIGFISAVWPRLACNGTDEKARRADFAVTSG